MPNMRERFDKFQVTRIQNLKLFPWSLGDFLLIGDAAHTMNPFIGQGFNGSMEECELIDNLVAQLKGDWMTIP
jgi:2-polyprenyl-6-methoxyphenol hydroxylase-like FAD-dependent oxidoreductase